MKVHAQDVRHRRVVGHLDGADVYHLQTKGGYNFLASSGAGGTTVLGVGPHPAVAKFMAQRQYPKLVLTELSKSAWHQLSQVEVETMLPEAERVMSLLGK